MPKKITTPTRRMCGASETHQRLCECDPGFRERCNRLHFQAEIFMLNGRAAKSIDSGKIRTLPAVVHVVYSTAEENISVKQVKSQIKVLNRDYSATNPDKAATPTPWKGLIIDSRICFALAKRDTEGKPTTGITRTKTDTALFGTYDEVKSSATGGVNVHSSFRRMRSSSAARDRAMPRRRSVGRGAFWKTVSFPFSAARRKNRRAC